MKKQVLMRFGQGAAAVLSILGAQLLWWYGQPHYDFGPVDPVTVVIATDLHYLSPELTDHGPYFRQLIENSDGKTMEYSEELVEAFVQQIIDQAPDVLVLSGDLTFNGELQSHIDLAAKLQRVADAGIAVLALPGNHDLWNPMAASFEGDGWQRTDSVSAEQFAEIYQSLGYGDTIAKDPNSLSYVAEPVSGLRVLMVDVNTAEAPGTVTEETLTWVENQLRIAARDSVRVLAVSHQNLLQHSSLIREGYVIENSAKLEALYQAYGVICNLSGHLHIQHIAQSEGGLPEIATSSLAVSPNQYGILTLDGTAAQYRTIPADVSGWAAEQGLEDAELLHFAEYSERFFKDTSRHQATAELAGAEDAEQMGAFFAEVNAAYFAGTLDTIQWDAALYDRWRELGGFTAAYLNSIAKDIPNNYASYSFEF